MAVFSRCFLLVTVCTLSIIQQVRAEETDQFTLPSYELQDIGPLASQRLFAVLEKVVAQTNSEIQFFLAQSKHSRRAASELKKRYKDSYIADLLYSKTGPGFPRWLRDAHLTNKSTLYKEFRPWNTVYWLSFSQSPLSLVGLAPTVNLYNYYFGTDKLGHFFMQGHTYYTIYTYYRNHGKSAEKAHAAIITYGQILEQTYLGTLINGIYSNGDLSANYAGWKFYMNLTHAIKIGEKKLPPILVLRNNQWEFSPYLNKETFLKPYLSDNLNEALNPCRYAFTRNQIRKQVKKRCAAWIARRNITPEFIKAKLYETSLWHGENYGHWLPPSNAVTLNMCFEEG